MPTPAPLVLPCLVFEDDDLLVVNKPAGLNTHAPDLYAGEGLYDWLRHREPRWANLAIIHRLDKETSGLLLFSKTARANRPLTDQFTRREVRKKYLLLAAQAPPQPELSVRSHLVRAGDRYLSRAPHAGGEAAETRFRLLSPEETGRLVPGANPGAGGRGQDVSLAAGSAVRLIEQCAAIEARPLTGRTHQIRVHAAQSGFPVLGDTLYGGVPAPRVYLHAAELEFRHPVTGAELTFCVPPAFEADPRLSLRAALLDPDSTSAFRLIHGAGDGRPGWYVERLGEYLLSQSEEMPGASQMGELERWQAVLHARGVFHKTLTRQVRGAAGPAASPRLLFGEAAPGSFAIRENGLLFGLSCLEGYSVGLFLDQRDNRRRLLTGHVAAGFDLPGGGFPGNRPVRVLNVFAYTCAFSVAAAKAGAQTTNLDLSRKYLEWGRSNFELNQLDPGGHEFIHGDAFEWLRRLARRPGRFDVLLLDPPTFSQSKRSGPFRAAHDYERLTAAALALLAPEGVLFASTNAADWTAGGFLEAVTGAVAASGRKILRQHYVPQPPDFPVSRSEPAYLKTVWLHLR